MKQKDLIELLKTQALPEDEIYIGHQTKDGAETAERAKCTATAADRFIIIGESACIKEDPEPEEFPRHLKAVK